MARMPVYHTLRSRSCKSPFTKTLCTKKDTPPECRRFGYQKFLLFKERTNTGRNPGRTATRHAALGIGPLIYDSMGVGQRTAALLAGFLDGSKDLGSREARFEHDMKIDYDHTIFTKSIRLGKEKRKGKVKRRAGDE